VVADAKDVGQEEGNKFAAGTGQKVDDCDVIKMDVTKTSTKMLHTGGQRLVG
jgi:hypothetical protein